MNFPCGFKTCTFATPRIVTLAYNLASGSPVSDAIGREITGNIQLITFFFFTSVDVKVACGNFDTFRNSALRKIYRSVRLVSMLFVLMVTLTLSADFYRQR